MTHSTPVLTTIQGVRQIVFATQQGLLSLNPLTGSRLWMATHSFSYSTSLAVSPVVYDDMVFISGAHSYGMGSYVVQAALSNSTWTTKKLWSTNNPASHWMTPVCYQGHLYGMFGIQSFDSPSAQFKCIEMRSGMVKWSQNNFGRGGTVLVDRHIVALTEKGQLVLVKPDTNAYVELGRFEAIPNYNADANKCWNGPAVCDGRIYVRSTGQGACYELSRPELLLKGPEILPSGLLRFTAVSTTGLPIKESRLAGLELIATSDSDWTTAQWQSLTINPLLTNGNVLLDNVDDYQQPQRYYRLRELQ